MGLVGFVFAPVLIGVIPLIMLLGYSLDTLRNVMNGQRYPMPEWTDWGGFLVRGLKLIGAFLVWALPLIVVAIPLGIGATLIDSNQNSGAAQTIGVILTICGGCLTLIWGLFMALVSPAIYVRIAGTNRFGSAFELGKLWAFTRDNVGSVIVALLLVWVASLIAAFIGMLGIVAIGIGLLVTIPFSQLWQYLVQAHLFGQIGAQSVTAIE